MLIYDKVFYLRECRWQKVLFPGLEKADDPHHGQEMTSILHLFRKDGAAVIVKSND